MDRVKCNTTVSDIHPVVRGGSGLLTDEQLRLLRRAPCPAAGNRVGLALSLGAVSQNVVATATGFTQPYVSDVACGRYSTISVRNAWRFARYFGCAIEDLFPEEPD